MLWYQGAFRECRYSGARRGIGGINGHWSLLGGVGVFGPSEGVRGVFGADRECRYSVARRGMGSIRGNWGLLRHVGAIRGHQGCIGGWQRV